ncbi:MAG: sulfotransferase family 2 domain-containing protein [Pirellulaceae bacterium]|nr:sulfotransferase family 2 domain-containing protein [Pirellulaceae bacterium]
MLTLAESRKNVTRGSSATAIGSASPTPRFLGLRLAWQKHFSPFKTYLRRDRGVIVFLNPKVGTTMFRSVLMDALKASGAKTQLSRWWPLRHTRRLLTAPPADFLHAALHPERYTAYAFVRNPYSRLLSAWRDKFAARHDDAAPPRALARTLPGLRKFAASRGLPLAADDAKVPFATFVAYVEWQHEGTRDHHWDTQRSVLCSDYIPYGRLFKMETEFTAGVIAILTHLGLPTEGVAEKLAQPMNASRKLSQPAYNADLAARVERIYACDFERLGYDRESWRGM